MAVVAGSRASAATVVVGSLVAVAVSAAIFVGYRRHRRGRRHQPKPASTESVIAESTNDTTIETTTETNEIATPTNPTTASMETTAPHTLLGGCDSVHAAQSPWKRTPSEPAPAETSMTPATADDDCYCCTTPRPSGVKVTRRLSISLADTDGDALATAVQRCKLSISVPESHDSDAETHSLASPTSSLGEHDEDQHDHHHHHAPRGFSHQHEDDGEPLARRPSMKEQSPIDIHEDESEIVPMASCPNAVAISMGADQAALAASDHGFCVQWTQPGANVLTIGGKEFRAVQFHFHTPSEHTLDGVHEELELHMVHQAEDGALAVLGVLFREGKTNPFLAQFWDSLATVKPGVATTTPLGALDPRALDILSGSFFRYRGSLTTPPYTEGVEWVVIHDVMEASREQLDIFHNALPGTNARDLQPLNHRHVWLAC